MIKHLVMWRLKASAHGNDKSTNARIIKQRLEALSGTIPGLLTIQVGINICEAESASDLVLFSEFVDRVALDAYQGDPGHRAIVPFVSEAQLDRRTVDYEVSDAP